jgi:4-amino-4-deoxy-L-arabinose transferase-like glycosyltransferase
MLQMMSSFSLERRNLGSTKLLAIVLVVGFGVLALFYSFTVPVWEAPDEINHFQFVRHLLSSRRLPRQQVGQLIEAHHPPFYYILAALVASPADLNGSAGAFRPNPDFRWAGGTEPNISFHHSAETFPYRGQALAVHLIRFVSVLMGTATVALTIAIGWRIFPQQPLVGLLAGALTAFNAQFLFISSAVNNDNLVILAVTGAIWQTLRAMKQPQELRQWFYLGLWLTVGVLAKVSALVMVGLAGLVLLLSGFSKQGPRILWRNLLAMGSVIVIGSGWWFLRNQLRYGDPLGWTAFEGVYADTLRRAPLRSQDIVDFFNVQFHSFWGVFGWMTVPAPDWYYTAIKIVLGLALVGCVFYLNRAWSNHLSGYQKRALLLLIAVFVGYELFLLATITRLDASLYQGRHLFPAIAPISLLVARGLLQLLGPISVQRRLAVVAGSGAVLCAVAAFMAVGVIGPTYEMTSLPKKTLWFIPNKVDATFGDMIGLRAYEVEPLDGEEQIALTLYWQALRRPDFNYSAFVHVVDAGGQLAGQSDGAPGEATAYPLQNWQPGDIVADRRVLSVSVDHFEQYRLRVGLYNWIDGQRLAVISDGSSVGDHVILELKD